MRIEKNKLVTIDFTMRAMSGQILDTSQGASPLAYRHGSGLLVNGLEAALEGKLAGDTIHVVLEPENAYGIRRPELVKVVPRSHFAAFANIVPGMQFEARGPNGEPAMISVLEVGKDAVRIDANHPLAGQRLEFDVTVVAVREPT